MFSPYHFFPAYNHGRCSHVGYDCFVCITVNPAVLEHFCMLLWLPMWHCVVCWTKCTWLHPVQSKGVLAPLAYCCLMHTILLKIYSEELSMSRSQISAWSIAIVAFIEHTFVVHTSCCDDLWGNVTRLSCVHQCHQKNAMWIVEEILLH